MNVLIGKRQIVLAALVVALGLAVFVNWYYTNPEPGTAAGENLTSADSSAGIDSGAKAQFASAKDDGEYFAAVKMNRDTAHGEAIETLQGFIDSCSDDDSDAQAQAVHSIETLSGNIKKESDIESLVTAKTGSGCVAVISDNTVEVVVSSSVLGDETVLQISDIVSQVCAGGYENIKISGTFS